MLTSCRLIARAQVPKLSNSFLRYLPTVGSLNSSIRPQRLIPNLLEVVQISLAYYSAVDFVINVTDSATSALAFPTFKTDPDIFGSGRAFGGSKPTNSSPPTVSCKYALKNQVKVPDDMMRSWK